ncbi:MAG: hypothetical protein PHO67_04005 [Candidatus Omnitrophica bacterium]|nr:hypothetical protein [Candidatus Omnitrophota bacterium]
MLEKIYPPWSKICDRYDNLHNELKLRNPEDFHRKEEALIWEQFAFELIVTILLHENIKFHTSADDVQPKVKTLDGKTVEIDFQVIIEDKPIYFGVTHFHSRQVDLGKNLKELNIPVTKLDTHKEGTVEGVITAGRDSNDYLNRRMVARVSKEGKNSLLNDYIYIFVPKVDVGFGGGIDAMPTNFNFSSSSNYEYKQNNISGIVLIGQCIEINGKSSKINEDKMVLKTLALNCRSLVAKKLLELLNELRLDMTERNKQLRKSLNS